MSAHAASLEIEQAHRAGHLDSNLIPSTITHIVPTAELSAITESDDVGVASLGMTTALVGFLTTTFLNEYDAPQRRPSSTPRQGH